MEYQFYIVDVFSQLAFGGNQLAVLPDASGITTEGMQKIAQEFNFPETTFVLPPKAAKTPVKSGYLRPKSSYLLPATRTSVQAAPLSWVAMSAVTADTN